MIALYVIALEPLLLNLGMIQAVMCDIDYRKLVSMHADDVIVIVSELDHLQSVGAAIKDYEAVIGAKNNWEN